MDEAVFTTPPLFTILCMMMGAAIFTTPYVRIFKCKDYSKALSFDVFVNAMYAFFVVALFSFLNALFVDGAFLLAEGFVILALLVGGVLHANVSGCSFSRGIWVLCKGLLANTARVIGFFICIGLLMAGLLMVFSIFEATLMTGVLLIAALYGLYSRYGDKEMLKFQKLLWPLVLGLLLLMAPLLIQDIANSEKFRESLHAPPPLQKV